MIKTGYLWLNLDKQEWYLYTTYERSYNSLELLMMALKTEQVEQLYIADCKIATYYFLQKYKLRNIKANKNVFYSYSVKDIKCLSIDEVFRLSFPTLCRSLALGAPSAANVKKVVEEINSISKYELGKDFFTIGTLAWKLLKDFGSSPEAFQQKYPFNDKQYKWFKDKCIYRGGLCLLNNNFQGIEINNLYKYDKNSFFSWVMKYGKMPMGTMSFHKGKPQEDFEDKLIHIIWSARAKFDGLAPYENKEFFLQQEMYIWGCELQELLNWYDTLEIEYIDYISYSKSEPDKQFGRFIDYFYPQKKTAQGARRQLVKLILNNIYGKFGQAPEKHYVRQVDNKIVTTVASNYIAFNACKEHSLAVASKITALARTELMRSIRVATHGRPDLYYVYGDTDSMILTIPFDDTGDGLGEFKYEGNFTKGKVLGKKCYMLYDNKKYECHACGVNRATLEAEMQDKPWEYAAARFNYNEIFYCPLFREGKITPAPRALSKGFENSHFDKVYGFYEEE